MAEVLRALNPGEVKSFMPMREMHEKQHREVYEAVGEQIMIFYELDEGFTHDGGDFLVGLEDGREVAFSYGVWDRTVDI